MAIQPYNRFSYFSIVLYRESCTLLSSSAAVPVKCRVAGIEVTGVEVILCYAQSFALTVKMKLRNHRIKRA